MNITKEYKEAKEKALTDHMLEMAIKEENRRMENKNKLENKWLFHVAGVQHHRLYKCADDLEKGSKFTLIPEPDNKFDPNAIKIVYYGSQGDVYQIGYVPKRLSAIITICVTRPGKITECILTDLDRDAEPWRQCQVLVKGEE